MFPCAEKTKREQMGKRNEWTNGWMVCTVHSLSKWYMNVYVMQSHRSNVQTIIIPKNEYFIANNSVLYMETVLTKTIQQRIDQVSFYYI